MLQQTLVYDARGRLVEVENGSGAVEESILYTADGDEANVTQNGVTTKFIVDEQSVTGYSEVLEEYQGGVLVNSYVYGNSLVPISQNTNAGGTGLSSVLLLGDGHSGVRQAYLPGSGIIMAQRFDAFGSTVAKVTAAGNPFSTVIGYRGQRFDSVLGQYYMRARMYDPVTGRFTAMDPDAGTYSDPLQLMRYGYASGDPIYRDDPSGQYDGVSSVAALGVIGVLAALVLPGCSSNNRSVPPPLSPPDLTIARKDEVKADEIVKRAAEILNSDSLWAKAEAYETPLRHKPMYVRLQYRNYYRKLANTVVNGLESNPPVFVGDDEQGTKDGTAYCPGLGQPIRLRPAYFALTDSTNRATILVHEYGRYYLWNQLAKDITLNPPSPTPPHNGNPLPSELDYIENWDEVIGDLGKYDYQAIKDMP